MSDPNSKIWAADEARIMCQVGAASSTVVKKFTGRSLAMAVHAMVDYAQLNKKEVYSMAQSIYETDAVVLRHESTPVFPA